MLPVPPGAERQDLPLREDRRARGRGGSSGDRRGGVRGGGAAGAAPADSVTGGTGAAGAAGVVAEARPA